MAPEPASAFELDPPASEGFCIRWRCRATGEEGQGEPISLEAATTGAEFGNREFPHIEHVVVPFSCGPGPREGCSRLGS